MNVYLVVLNLAAAVVLLLWSVRMVKTGVERSHSALLRRVLRDRRGGRVWSALTGVTAAVMLQSSTAVAMLLASFAATNLISLPAALAGLLGADLGSALVARMLTFDLGWLTPVLVVVGGGLFLKGMSRQVRQTGRILLGMGLVLISLSMIAESTQPLRESELLPGMVAYLESDLLTAFLLGAIFTWLVHSGVASILLIATLAAHDLIPPQVGVTLMLGANLGSGLIALGLARAGEVEARRVVAGNALFRGVGAITAVIIYHFAQPDLGWLGGSVASQVIHAHIAFNLCLLAVFLPFTDLVARLVTRLMSTPTATANDDLVLSASRLDATATNDPVRALASVKREVLRMAELVERMIIPLMSIYETGDPQQIRYIKRLEEAVDRAQGEVKLYLAQIAFSNSGAASLARGRSLMAFAVNLEHAGDAVVRSLLKLAEICHREELHFSPEGWKEVTELHARLLHNLQLSLNVLISEDHNSAELLLQEKAAMRMEELASASRHFDRLRGGGSDSIDSSDVHLETVRALRTINSLLASTAYPVLEQAGMVRRSSSFPTADVGS